VSSTAVEIELFGAQIKVISIEDLIAAKEALGRDKDKFAATELRAVYDKRMKAMNPILIEAIKSRRRLAFTYNAKPRVVEPQCYGIGKRGTELLRAHQLEGGTEREPLFDVSKIEKLVVLEQRFGKAGPNYKQDDSAMNVIFAQLELDLEDGE
jgi:predicted DNA-binding transcriptional regulator YafY